MEFVSEITKHHEPEKTIFWAYDLHRSQKKNKQTNKKPEMGTRKKQIYRKKYFTMILWFKIRMKLYFVENCKFSFLFRVDCTLWLYESYVNHLVYAFSKYGALDVDTLEIACGPADHGS